MYDIPRYHTFTFCHLIHKLYFCRTLKNKMATINDLKAKLIQEDKLMSIERINEIREKNILSYIKSFIGQQGDFIRPKTFSDITGISEHSISRILNASHLRPEQQLRWCLCIWNNWDKIVEELDKKHRAIHLKFDKKQFLEDFNQAFHHFSDIVYLMKDFNTLEENINIYQQKYCRKSYRNRNS